MSPEESSKPSARKTTPVKESSPGEGSRDGAPEDKEDVRNAPLLESEQLEQVRLDVEKLDMDAEKSEKGKDGGLRTTAEKLRLLVQSARSGYKPNFQSEEMKLERERVEAEKLHKRPLVAKELMATAERLRIQAEQSLGFEGQLLELSKEFHEKVLEHERGTLSEQLRKQDKVLEKMRELRGQDCDGLMALVEREVQEIDAELLTMRLADFAETAPDAQERDSLLALSDDELLALEIAMDNSNASRAPIRNKLYWNEAYESCTYDEAEIRFTGWLKEYQQDREAHEQVRNTHADPTTLDAKFAVELMEAPRRRNEAGAITSFLPASLTPFTNMLLAGARVNGNRLCSSLDEIVDLLETTVYSPDVPVRNSTGLSGRESLELVNFVEALVASGSMAVLTAMREAGNCDWPLPKFVLTAVVSGSIWGAASSIWGSLRTTQSGRDRAFRRCCLRLLARMSFLSAERALAANDTHPFMALLQSRPGGGIYPVKNVHEWYLRRPENHDAITHLMYLTVFMNRRYPWPRRHRHRADIEMAKWLQEDNTNWHATSPMFGLTKARDTLTLAAILPGFLQTLLEDQTLWLLLAVCGCAEDGGFDERKIYAALLLQLPNRGRGGGYLWNGRGLYWNSFFSSRREEDRLISMLRRNRELSTWLCGPGGRSILLDICRQRRLRALKAVKDGASCAFDAAVPELLAFVRGPNVRGKKERLTEWLESSQKASEERVSDERLW